jgi:hypothetical protein
MPKEAEPWPPTGLREKVVKIGAKVVTMAAIDVSAGERRSAWDS